MGTPTETSTPLRVALVGYGLAGRAFHAPLIATTPGLRLHSIVTADPGRRAEALRDHPGVKVVADTGQLLADPADLDLVVIASPTTPTCRWPAPRWRPVCPWWSTSRSPRPPRRRATWSSWPGSWACC